MIFSSGIMRPSPIYLQDGQAIAVTTEDEGVWLSLDYGVTWMNIVPDNTFDFAVLPSTQHASGEVNPSLQLLSNTDTVNFIRKVNLSNMASSINARTGGGLTYNDMRGHGDFISFIYNYKSVITRRAYDPVSNLDGYGHFFFDNILDVAVYKSNYIAVLTASALGLASAYFNNNYSDVALVYSEIDYPFKILALSDTELQVYGQNVYLTIDVVSKTITGQGTHPFILDGNYINTYSDYIQTSSYGHIIGCINGRVANSNDFGLTWSTLFSAVDVRGVGISKSGQIQAVGINNDFLKLSTDYGQSFNNCVSLGIKKITGISVYKREVKLILRQG